MLYTQRPSSGTRMIDSKNTGGNQVGGWQISLFLMNSTVRFEIKWIRWINLRCRRYSIKSMVSCCYSVVKHIGCLMMDLWISQFHGSINHSLMVMKNNSMSDAFNPLSLELTNLSTHTTPIGVGSNVTGLVLF